MKESSRLISVLTIVCLIAALAVSIANDLTKDAIAESREKQKLSAVCDVLPEGASDVEEKILVQTLAEGNIVSNTYYKTETGYAIPITVSNGYGGDISLMIGFSEDVLWSYKVLKHSETPGLGAHIKDSFVENVERKPIFNTNWAVDKDGGDIPPITAATISSRAVCDAIKQGVKILKTIESGGVLSE
ncbi:MAG: RnfABCDGE type electron transport complex subunit G [Lentisphaerae bacterium]|jgi:electron transport complex protein RnfG|nr:RnfABCDGE type electron transport complex subunit G [Lentisphaerota bacterium]